MSETRSEFIARKRAERRQLAKETRGQWEAQSTCPHPRRELVASDNRNGVKQYWDACTTCRKPLSQAYNYASIPDPDSVPVVTDDHYYNPPCVVCGAFGTELHHWAPREFFGFECDDWPTAYLCVPCHQRWHRYIREALSFDVRQKQHAADAKAARR